MGKSFGYDFPVVVRVTRQTPKAFFVTDGERHCWVSKSVCRTKGWDFDLVQVPLGIVKGHGLFTPPDWEPADSTRQATLYVLREYGYASKRMTDWLRRHDKKLTVWLERYRKRHKAK